MNNVPLLKVKLTAPEIPEGVLYSKRIKDLGIAGHRVVVITAPAGSGKTTAALLSIGKKANNIRWYRMEREDSFLPVFYAHLIETLFSMSAKSTTESARSLESIGKISEEYHLLNAVICQDAWTLYPDISDSIYIVFDDFHKVSDNAAIVESIRYFIANMPPNLRIILISRTDTGIFNDKQALKGDTALIDQNALRFTKEEVHTLASEVLKFNMQSDDIDRIYEYSEGWIAGIWMLIHSASTTGLNMDKLLQKSDESRQSIFRYFLSEALNKTDKDMIKNLARASILPGFTCDDLKSVFSMENAGEILDWLEKNNMYIQKFKTGATSYRFHSLFRSALLSALNELFSPEEIEQMNISAARHFEKLGDFNIAIRFLLSAGKTQEALKIASVHGIRFMDAGDLDRVMSIVQEFPMVQVQGDRYLLFMYGASLMRVECEESYSYLHRSFLSFGKSGELDMQMKSVGLIIAISFVRNDFMNIKSVLSEAPKFKMITKSKYARVALLMSAFMGTAWEDKLVLGDKLHRLIERLNFYEPLWDYTFKLAKGIILYRKGNLEAAGEIIDPILNHPTALINDHWRSIGLAMCHAVTTLRRDIKRSQKLAEEFASIGEKYNSDYARGYAKRITAYCKYQTRDINDAISQMDESVNAFTQYGNQIMVCVEKITKYMWEAEYGPVGSLAQKAFAELKILEALKPGQGFLELCQAITGILFKECSNYEEAEKLLSLAYKTSRGKKALQSMCGTAMHLADLNYRKGNYKLEEKYLNIWGKLADSGNYIYFREMNYTTLVRVCARCIDKNINSGYMGKIIAIYFGAAASEYILQYPGQASTEPKVFIANYLIASQKSKSIRIKLFGSFRIFVDDVEIGESEWKTRKICGIIKYILANPRKIISREVLSTVFWPESDTKAASTSLRAALYELRKTLARFNLAFDSDDALIAENKNGFYLCSKGTAETDVDIFSGLYQQYKSKKLVSGEIKDLLIRMTSLYEGDFLGSNLYDEWISLSREHYKSIFIEGSYNLARMHIADGEWEQGEALLLRHMKVDPFDEKACGMLIHLYNSTGQKNRAASLCRQFEKRFETEMGIKPDLTYS